MNSARIKFWLSRDLEEQTNRLQAIACRISILNYQVQNFDKMSADFYKEETVENLIKDLKFFQRESTGLNWSNSIKEMEDELNKEG